MHDNLNLPKSPSQETSVRMEKELGKGTWKRNLEKELSSFGCTLADVTLKAQP